MMRRNSPRRKILTTAAGLLFASSPVVVRVDGFAGSGWTAAAAADDGRRRSAADADASSFCDRTATALSAAASPKRDQGNPFSSFIGDVASSLLGGGEGMRSNAAVDEALARAEGVPSWSDVRSQLESLQQTPEERLFRRNLDGGYGAASPLHEMRLFDESNGEEDVRVTFYRDSASWCPYCQKVWIALEEKRIPHRIEKINMRCYGDKPASFTRMQPSGQIPVAEIDGTVYRQSNDILFALEERFPESKSLLRPEDGAKARELFRLERRLFGAWMHWLTSGGGSAALKQEFVQTLQRVERVLAEADGPFFLGKDVSLVDVQFAPFLERMAASLLYFKGFQVRVAPGEPTDFPAVNGWFDAMETLPSYQLTKSDYYTHCWDLPPQLGGCAAEPGGEPHRRAINGERRRAVDGSAATSAGSWELPLRPHNGGIEPDWTWAGDEAASRREAVERVSANHGAIVKFAARGAGRAGFPPVAAPLADPNATPSEAVQGAVDSALRIICAALLDGTEKQDAAMLGIAKTIVEKGDNEFATGVVDSLSYLRDRIGVPRDMKLPAARQLRAHLNWSIGKILDVQDSSA